MANSAITLYNRIEPTSKKSLDQPPQEKVSAMTFSRDMAVFWADVPELPDGYGGVGRPAGREARVIFQGNMYRFMDTEQNREAIRVFVGKLGGLG